MVNSVAISAPTFNTTVQRIGAAGPVVIPVSTKTPTFIVGPNGAGKSGLIHLLFRQNPDWAVRVSAHRQTSMETNSVPFSPHDKKSNESTSRSQDRQPSARYLEWNSSGRSGLVIADIIEADNSISRKVRAAVVSGDHELAKQLAAEQPPIEAVNELFSTSGIPIKVSIEDDSSIVASKRGGVPYSIAALSDGERAALLIAGIVLTAPRNSLVLVDEPERHLHASIVTPLLLQLFAKRADCTFVVSTHELSLPTSCKNSRTVLVRDSEIANDYVQSWDLDVLESDVEIDEQTKESILGSRRKMIFIEGKPDSMDKPLYELLFPSVSIFPRESCTDVDHAVTSVRSSSEIVWVKAFGIVDQDQLTPERKVELEAKGVFPLSVYSVEALYYLPQVVEAVAQRQCDLLGGNAIGMVEQAWSVFHSKLPVHVDRLAARMSEQMVKDQVALGMLNWKQIQEGKTVSIAVDAQAIYEEEKVRLGAWIASKDHESILKRYPVRETPALDAVAKALQFAGRAQYEAAVRKLVRDKPGIREALLEHFGSLPSALAV